MKEKNKYTWDGDPIYEAFDNEEEYEKAVEEHVKEILALWDDLEEHSKQWDVAHPEIATKRRSERAIAEAAHARSEAAARAAAEAESAENEVAPESHSS